MVVLAEATETSAGQSSFKIDSTRPKMHLPKQNSVFFPSQIGQFCLCENNSFQDFRPTPQLFLPLSVTLYAHLSYIFRNKKGSFQCRKSSSFTRARSLLRSARKTRGRIRERWLASCARPSEDAASRSLSAT